MCPVMNDASCDARKAMAAAISSGVPSRSSMFCCRRRASRTRSGVPGIASASSPGRRVRRDVLRSWMIVVPGPDLIITREFHPRGWTHCGAPNQRRTRAAPPAACPWRWRRPPLKHRPCFTETFSAAMGNFASAEGSAFGCIEPYRFRSILSSCAIRSTC